MRDITKKENLHNRKELYILSTDETILHRICKEIYNNTPSKHISIMKNSFDYLKNHERLINGKRYFVSYWKHLFRLIKGKQVEKNAKIALWFTHYNYYTHIPNDLTVSDLMLTLDYVNLILTMSDMWTNWLIKRSVPESKIINLKVGGGVDLEIFKPSNIRGDYVGLVGWYKLRKNGPFLLKLMKRLPNFPWMIIGRDWDTIPSFLEVTKNLSDFVYYKEIDYLKFPKLYHKMRVYLSISSYEGGPIPPLEALASGVPVVLSDTGFARNLVRPSKNGYIFPVDDIDLAEHYLKLAYYKKKWDARESVKNLTWDNFAKKIWAAINDLL